GSWRAGPWRAPRRGRPRRHAGEEDELLPDLAPDVGADLGVDAAAQAGRQERLDTLRPAPVVLAEHQALHRTLLRDHAGPADVGADIGDAADERRLADDRTQHVVLLHAVLA